MWQGCQKFRKKSSKTVLLGAPLLSQNRFFTKCV
jgi:hypothetical protein